MSDGLGRTGLLIGGAVIGNILLPGGGTLLGAKISGAAIGAMGGSYLGSVLFPTKFDQKMPPMSSYPLQRSDKGQSVPKTYGTVNIAGNIIYMGETHPYTIKHSSGGGKGGGDDAEQIETRYRKSFLIGICKGPTRILRAWKGKKEIPISQFTSFDGNSNTGIGALIGKDFAEYPDLCCAWFDEYDLANTQQIPNFTFEVTTYDSDKIPISSVDELLAMNDNRNAFNQLIGDYELLSDLDLTGIDASDGWFQNGASNDMGGLIGGSNGGINLRGYFIGTFDGRGHTISNLDMTTETFSINTGPWGLFGYTDSATIKNLHLRNFTINCDSDVNLVGLMAGTASETTFSNCSVEGIINLNTATPNRIGGFAGGTLALGGCTVNSCSANVTINILDPVIGITGIGGFWGRAGQTDNFFDCWARGAIISGAGAGTDIRDVGGFADTVGTAFLGTRNRCWAAVDLTNLVTIRTTYGGFAPDTDGIDTDCYWDEDVSGVTFDNSDATPKSTSEMKTQSTFENYNFNDVWKMTGNNGYPALIVDPIEFFDENPAIAIKDLLTNNTGYGAAIDSSFIDDVSFSAIETYCKANDFLFSFNLNQQRPIQDWLDYMLSHFQGFIYESNGKISLGAFKDDSATGDPITRDNLVVDAGENPPPAVNVRKRDYSETSNRVEIGWTNRPNDYDASVIVANDETDQRISGEVRKRTINLQGTMTKDRATKLTWRMLYESLYRFSVYTFRLSYQDMLLQVGDVKTLSDGFLIDEQRIRITSISESKDGRNLDVEAVEDLPYMYPDLSTYDSQDTEHISDPDFADLIASPLYAYREHRTSNLLHISLTPTNEFANGWYIYRSFDDITYELVGQVNIDGVTNGDANSQGTMTSNLPAHTAIVHKKDEVFTVDIGTVTDLIGTNDEGLFSNTKICKIDDEIIGYKTVTDLGDGIWEVSELIRGLFNTEPVSHSSGASIKTLDISLNLSYNEDDIGRTMFFKALTFYGTAIQNIADVSSSSRVIKGNIKRPLPVSLARIRYREGKTTYLTDDVVIDWYWNSRASGFNTGGHGETLWNSFTLEDMIETINVLLEQTDGTDILEEVFETKEVGEPLSLFIPEADRDGNNPIKITLTPGSTLAALEGRTITIDKI